MQQEAPILPLARSSIKVAVLTVTNAHSLQQPQAVIDENAKPAVAKYSRRSRKVSRVGVVKTLL